MPQCILLVIGRAGASPPSRTTGPRCLYVEPPTNMDSSVFIRILKLSTDEKLKNRDE